MTTTSKINAHKLEASLEWCEINPDLEADCRLVLRDERIALQSALRSGDREKIMDAAAEALRVCRMWNVNIAY